VGIGSAALGGGAVTALASVHGLLRSQQGHVMPHLMEGIYLADRSGNGSREVLRRYGSALLLAGCAAALVGPWIFVRTVSGSGLEQTPGGYNPFPTEGWERVAAWVSQPKPPDLRAVALMATGGLVTLGLVLLRLHWVGSPFHPLGYAISGGWGLGMIATPLFLAWLVKVLLLPLRRPGRVPRGAPARVRRAARRVRDGNVLGARERRARPADLPHLAVLTRPAAQGPTPAPANKARGGAGAWEAGARSTSRRGTTRSPLCKHSPAARTPPRRPPA
jgi:hypothetical protein